MYKHVLDKLPYHKHTICYYSLKSSKSFLPKEIFRSPNTDKERKKVGCLGYNRVGATAAFPSVAAETPAQGVPGPGSESLLQVNPVHVAKIKHRLFFLTLYRLIWKFYNATKYKVKR